jgi:hypothetical protein
LELEESVRFAVNRTISARRTDLPMRILLCRGRAEAEAVAFHARKCGASLLNQEAIGEPVAGPYPAGSEPLQKYPRTQHIEGSRLQPGDHDLSAVLFAELEGKPLVVEEKLDGANSAISFDRDDTLLLQSRGHYLMGGARERQFDLLKTWAHSHHSAFREVLGQRYVMYGEWVYAKHTVFYDQLPHYFMEFDVYDREHDQFLSTERRARLLSGLPIASVPVLHSGQVASRDELAAMIRRSLYKSAAWEEELVRVCDERGYRPERAWQETDRSPLSEGLYVKWEEAGQVQGRFKFIRPSFLTAVVDSGSHWMDRPVLPNQLQEGVDLYEGAG